MTDEKLIAKLKAALGAFDASHSDDPDRESEIARRLGKPLRRFAQSALAAGIPPDSLAAALIGEGCNVLVSSLGYDGTATWLEAMSDEARRRARLNA